MNLAATRKAQPRTSAAPQSGELGPIVSSAHLATGLLPALSELEFGLILLGHAFNRWIVHCAAAAGFADLSALEVLVLHTVNHRGRPKRLADICLVLNIEDTHLVTYAVKKLQAQGLVASGRRGKEKTVSIAAKGEGLCRRYREIREALLVKPVRGAGADEHKLSELAGTMRALSGHYDQAARSAASL
jgi:predicted MarR family transcription regulator